MGWREGGWMGGWMRLGKGKTSGKEVLGWVKVRVRKKAMGIWAGGIIGNWYGPTTL